LPDGRFSSDPLTGISRKLSSAAAKVAAFSSGGERPGGGGLLPVNAGVRTDAEVAVPRGDGLRTDAAISSPVATGLHTDAKVSVPRSDGALTDAAIPSPVAANALPAAQNSPNGDFRHTARQNFPDSLESQPPLRSSPAAPPPRYQTGMVMFTRMT